MNKKDIQVWMKKYKNFKELILELLYPNKCILCGTLNRKGICNECKVKYPFIQEPRCMCCGKPIHTDEAEYCNDCAVNKHAFNQGRSLWIHTGSVKQSIYRFKYKNYRVYAKEYAKLLVESNRVFLERWKPEGILPIPIHTKRRRKRGYNQAEILANEIQKEMIKEELIEPHMDIKILSQTLKRKKQTVFQKKLDDRQRKKNIKGAFSINEKVKLPDKVLIIDDIYTTGATMQEVSEVLRNTGVKQVVFLTISIGQGF